MVNPTVLIHDPKGSSYVKCTAKGPFIHPLSDGESHADVNKQLNLNLGQSLLDPNNKTILWIIRFLNDVFVSWWEKGLFRCWNSLPVTWRRAVTFLSWRLYLPLHKAFLGRKTGIHVSVSEEYHALTTVMWLGRFFPVSVSRMRFSLQQLTASTREPQVSRIEKIKEPCKIKTIPEDQREHCTVEGLYVHVAEEPTDSCLFWIYGGAFLSGDAEGNIGPAERIGRQSGMDVFLVSHRLVPEALMKDMLWDTTLGYRWLCQKRKSQGKDPSRIFLLGISSGAGLATRLAQTLSETIRGEDTLPSYLSTASHGLPLPAGAVLMGPFCDYTEPKGSLLAYAEHDLIVNPRVLESGLSYLETHMGGSRRDHSPIFRSFQGLPPLCVVTSTHEALYDQAVDLINNARKAGASVTVGCWSYMCHVFSFLNGFIPEGEQSMVFAEEWLRQQDELTSEL